MQSEIPEESGPRYKSLSSFSDKAKSNFRQLQNIDTKTAPIITFDGASVSALLIALPIIVRDGMPMPSIMKMLFLIGFSITVTIFTISSIFALRCVWLSHVRNFDVPAHSSREAVELRIIELQKLSDTRFRSYLIALYTAIAGAISLFFVIIFYVLLIALSSGMLA